MDTNCINNNTWQEYASGKLNEAEREAVFLHAASCEICGDILEGINAMNDPGTLAKKVQHIGQEIDRRLAPAPASSRNKAWYMAAAAALILASAAGWYTMSRKAEQPIALKQEPAPGAQKPVAKKQPDTPNEMAAEPAVARNKPAKNKAPFVYTNTPPAAQKEEKKEAEKAGQNAGLYDKITHKEQQALTEKALEDKDAYLEQETSKLQSGRELSDVVVTSAKSKKQKASASYYLETTTDSATFRVAAAFYEAMQYDSCTNTLLPLVNNAASAYYEESLLLAARACIARNEKPMARRHLKTLISLKGKKAAEAEVLLNTIK